MSVSETSKVALDEIRDKLPEVEQMVYRAIVELGCCHDNRLLEYLRQAVKLRPKKWGQRKRQWEISDVNGRRNTLLAKGVISCIGKFHGFWCDRPKYYQFYALANSTIKPAGWYEAIDDMPDYIRDKYIKMTRKKGHKYRQDNFKGLPTLKVSPELF